VSYRRPLLISDQVEGAGAALQDLTPAIKSNGNSSTSISVARASGCGCGDRLASGFLNGVVSLETFLCANGLSFPDSSSELDV
jgi:hypothetical protein